MIVDPMNEEPKRESAGPSRPVDYEYSPSLVTILGLNRLSLLITTYQAGKLVVVGTRGDSPDLVLSHRKLARPMGMAIRPESAGFAVAADTQIWQFGNVPQFTVLVDPSGTHDACYLPRHASYTGPIDAHEIAWCGSELWVVNTLFSCLCTLNGVHNFVPRWKPSFITALAAEDRCHLNGLAVHEGRPAYVTALGESNTLEGWRPGKAAGGCVIDVASKSTVVRGLSMPHSPRIHNGDLWLLESGHGRLVRADRARGVVEPVAETPGYARGLAFAGRHAFVGYSRFRSSSAPRLTFDNLPISERTTPLSCGVSVLDLGTGQEVSRLEFHAGIDEIFDVQALAQVRNPWISGPDPMTDGIRPVWVIPNPKGV
jgi:uncharacterized protein (TIGR03032 family)